MKHIYLLLLFLTSCYYYEKQAETRIMIDDSTYRVISFYNLIPRDTSLDYICDSTINYEQYIDSNYEYMAIDTVVNPDSLMSFDLYKSVKEIKNAKKYEK